MKPSYGKKTLFSQTIVIVLSLLAGSLSAQQQIKLQLVYLPETRYVTESEVSVESNVIFEEIDDSGQQEENTGAYMPFGMILDQKVSSVMQTGTRDTQGSFPWQIHFEEFDANVTIEGESMDINLGGIDSVIINGYVDSTGQMSVKSFTGHFDQEQEQTLTNFMDNVIKQVKFPDQSISVGESFTISQPLNVPLGDMAVFEMLMETVFLLNKIEDNLAFFDITIHMTLNSDMDIGLMTADGNGNGTMVVDINQGLPLESTTEMDLNMKIESPGLSVTAFTKNYASTKMTIINDSDASE
ncbi:MAG: hypothetical protein ACOCX0_01455 [Bacteroidota bacterium]